MIPGNVSLQVRFCRERPGAHRASLLLQVHGHVRVQVGLAREVEAANFTGEGPLGMLHLSVAVELGLQNKRLVAQVALKGSVVFVVCFVPVETDLGREDLLAVLAREHVRTMASAVGLQLRKGWKRLGADLAVVERTAFGIWYPVVRRGESLAPADDFNHIHQFLSQL